MKTWLGLAAFTVLLAATAEAQETVAAVEIRQPKQERAKS